MFRKMVGLASLMAGLAAIAASSVCGSRASVAGDAPKPDGPPGAPEAAAQVPRRNRKRGTRPMSKLATPPEVAVTNFLDGLKDNEHFKGSTS